MNATGFLKSGLKNNLNLVIFATLSRIAGSYFGNILLKKVTQEFFSGYREHFIKHCFDWLRSRGYFN